MAPLRKRVRILLDVKEIKKIEKVKERAEGIEDSVGDGGEKSFNIVSWNYDSVKTNNSD